MPHEPAHPPTEPACPPVLTDPLPPPLPTHLQAEADTFFQHLESFNRFLAQFLAQEENLQRLMAQRREEWLAQHKMSPACSSKHTTLQEYAKTVYAPKVRLAHDPKKGRILLATKDIAIGEIIIAEDALIRVSPIDPLAAEIMGPLANVFEAAKEVVFHRSEPQCTLLRELSNAHESNFPFFLHLIDRLLERQPDPNLALKREELARWFGVLQTNALGYFQADRRLTSIHLLISMLSHSCEPNALHTHKDSGTFIQARKQILKDTEITISYVDTNLPLLERQKILIFGFRFTCDCPRCQADIQQTQESTPRTDR